MQTILHCLQHAVHNITNTYTEAVLAYAFALAGDYEITQELLYKLEEQAIKSGADCWGNISCSVARIWSSVSVHFACLEFITKYANLWKRLNEGKKIHLHLCYN